jgi:alpha-beta hydrolase superfamily lysophospholipase
MKPTRWILLLAGLLLVAASVGQIRAAERGITIVPFQAGEIPATAFYPAGIDPASRPAVMIAHGFSGSQEVMRGFALDLAHAGYTALTWDFDGHGRNPRPLEGNIQAGRSGLAGNAEAVLAAAAGRGLAGRERTAILGHSMGSGVALAYGQEHPGTAAVIAVSPVGQPVTPELPRNLLLMAGTSEAGFLDNARQRLAEAGGAGTGLSGDPALGTARRLIPIQHANHLTILFAGQARRAARAWLDLTFGPQPGAVPAAAAVLDPRLAWYGLGMLGTVLAAVALVGGLAQGWNISEEQKAAAGALPAALLLPWRRLGALPLGALAATLGLWLLGRIGLDLSTIFGLRIGGYLLVWFMTAGLAALLAQGARIERFRGRAAPGGLLVFAALWLGVGLLGSLVWQPWLLIPARLVLWPLAALLVLPWFLAAGQALHGAGWLGQLGGWLLHSLALAGGLLLALVLDPGLGFLALILPVFPVVLLFHGLACLPFRGGWAFALSGALFVAWLVLVVFPLA